LWGHVVLVKIVFVEIGFLLKRSDHGVVVLIEEQQLVGVVPIDVLELQQEFKINTLLHFFFLPGPIDHDQSSARSLGSFDQKKKYRSGDQLGLGIFWYVRYFLRPAKESPDHLC
jgi:hypothetical protein